jgi:broad specificity phosphatase PhoE
VKLLLIRHGESRGNARRQWQGWLDEPLTQQGQEQARRLAERLQRWSVERAEPIEAVYSSTLARAYQTAHILAQCWGVPLVLDKRLRERDVGLLQGLTWPEVETRYPQVAEMLHQRWVISATPGGETLAHLVERVWRAVEAIVTRTNHHETAGSVAVVSHGGTLNAYLNRLIGRGDEVPNVFSLGNTSLSVVEIRDGRPRILLVNDLCHLEQT